MIRLLWTATRLANAVGKKTSLKDVVAGLTLDDESTGELRRNEVSFMAEVFDFRNVTNVVFFATPHSHPSWSRKLQFELDDKLQPPFTAVIKTPSGGFQPMRRATVKINGKEVATLSWPNAPTANVIVELERSNVVEFEVDGPQFGSMEVAIRGARIQVEQ